MKQHHKSAEDYRLECEGYEFVALEEIEWDKRAARCRSQSEDRSDKIFCHIHGTPIRHSDFVIPSPEALIEYQYRYYGHRDIKIIHTYDSNGVLQEDYRAVYARDPIDD